MCRGDLNAAGSEFLVNIIILDHGDLAADERQDQHLADAVLIALVLGIDGNSRIAKQRLGTGRSKLNISRPVFQRIAQMPERTLLVFVFNFGIGDRCQAFRAPVDDALTTIDQAFVIVLNKYIFNCFRAAFVHGESFVFPVTGRSNLLELLNDTSLPRSSFVRPSSFIVATILASVAMDAWSVPGTQRVSKPFILL